MVERNKIYRIKIDGLSHQGLGVGRVNGFVVFVSNTLPGEIVEARVMKVLKDHSYARINKMIVASPDRSEPFCKIYSRCGGCSLQHMRYDFQLHEKTNRVKECFERIGGMKDLDIRDTIGMVTPFDYRNKVQFPVSMVGEKAESGFYARRSHDIVPCKYCAIQHPVSNRIKDIVMDYVRSNNISVYDENRHEGLLRHIVVRVSEHTKEIMIILVVTSSNDKEKFMSLIDILKDQIKGFVTLVLNINSKNTNVIMGQENVNLFGGGIIRDKIGSHSFMLSPQTFFQINPKQTEILYEKIIELAGIKGNETVFDLYCGAGTIAIYMANSVKKVYGIESSRAAIENANVNSDLNRMPNTSFIVGRSEEIFPRLVKQGISADLVIVDPPRKGCHKKVLDTISHMKPDKVVYVSCNPSTLARDVKILVNKGYEVGTIQPVDMFPHTEHVETVLRLVRT